MVWSFVFDFFGLFWGRFSGGGPVRWMPTLIVRCLFGNFFEGPVEVTSGETPTVVPTEWVPRKPSAEKAAGAPPYNTLGPAPTVVRVTPTATSPTVVSKVAHGKSTTTGKVTPSIVGRGPVVWFTFPTSYSYFRGLFLGGMMTDTVTENKAVPTTVVTTVNSCAPFTDDPMPGAWTSLLAKPPVSGTVVDPEAAPDGATFPMPEPRDRSIVTMFGTPANLLAAWDVDGPIATVPGDK